MASFFNKIDAPDLTQSAKSIETMVQAINDNFQKVFTLPFLKGDPGDEITTRFEYFWDDKNLLTQEAADIFNTVFELKNVFTVGLSFDGFIQTLMEYQIINDENIEKPYWSDNYGPTKEPKVLLYYKINAEDTTEEKIGVAQLYYFFDPRITLLSNNDLLYNKSFKDYTCILTTEYNIDENGNYSYKYIKQTGWPTLYYNQTTSQFCWAINGHQTGINAQGVNGKDGIGSKVWLVKLNNTSQDSGKIFDLDEKYLENYYTRFSIESVWYPTLKSWIDKTEMESKLQKNSGQIFTNDDVFIGYVTGSDPQMEIGLWEYNNENLINTNEYIKDIPVPDMWIGTLHYDETAKENEDKYFVMCNISQNLSVANNNMNLCKMLADIKPSTNNDDPNHLKGLYLRSDDKNIHAIFNGGHIETGNTDLYIAPTTLEYMSNSNKIETIPNKNLNIIYNTNLYGEATITGNLYISKDIIPIETDIISNIGDSDNWFNNTYTKSVKAKGIEFHQTTGNDWSIGGFIDFFGKQGDTRSTRLIETNGEIALINNGGVSVNTGGYEDGYGHCSFNASILKGRQLQIGTSGAEINGILNVTGATTLKNSNLYIGDKSNNNLSIDLLKSNKTYNISINSNNELIIKDDSNSLLTFGTTTDSYAIAKFANIVQATTFLGNLQGNATSASKLNIDSAIGGESQPVYFNKNGKPEVCSMYAGGTQVTLNGTGKGSSTAALYAPTGSGDAGQVLVSNGDGSAPEWKNYWEYDSLLYTGELGDSGSTSSRLEYTSDKTIDITFYDYNNKYKNKKYFWKTIYLKTPSGSNGVNGDLFLNITDFNNIGNDHCKDIVILLTINLQNNQTSNSSTINNIFVKYIGGDKGFPVKRIEWSVDAKTTEEKRVAIPFTLFQTNNTKIVFPH